MKTAIFKGIDGFNRPVFKEKNSNNFYCLIDCLFSCREDFTLSGAIDHTVYFKGNTFQGEPAYPVYDIELDEKTR